MTNVSTVVGYPQLHAERDRRRRDRAARTCSRPTTTEIGLGARRPTALLDRVNLLLMAGQMNSTLEGQILSAVSAIDIPTGDQNAINAALAEPRADGNLSDDGFTRLRRAAIGAQRMCKHDQSRRQFLRTASMASMAGVSASPFLLELNSLAAMAQSSGTSDYALWSASFCRAATTATAP